MARFFCAQISEKQRRNDLHFLGDFLLYSKVTHFYIYIPGD